MKKGILNFHQGWTDVINCLPLVDWYLTKYDDIILVSRFYMKDIIDFYLRGKSNVNVVYSPTDDIDTISKKLLEINQCDSLFHGFHDYFRTDEYKGTFTKIYHKNGRASEQETHFVKLFYEAYSIPYINRIDKFNFVRDENIENMEYFNFIKKYSTEYILYHSDVGDKTINFNKNEKINYINLNGITKNIFSYIKILENSKELHLTDSMWASFCYIIDAKWQIFKNKPIFLYPFPDRSGGCCAKKDIEKLEPLNLLNWKIIK